MAYVLNSMDIQKILLEGKFDEKKYESSLVVSVWTVGSLLNSYLEDNKEKEEIKKFKEFLEKGDNKEIVYNSITQFYIKEETLNDEEKQFNNQMKALIERYIGKEINKTNAWNDKINSNKDSDLER